MTSPYFTDDAVTIHHGDCIDVLATLPAASVDAVVCDPPYGLEFMGKDWDSFKPGGKRPTLGAADGSPMRRNTGTPAWGASGNPGCSTCGGQRYGNNPQRQCKCETPSYGNPMAAQMRAFQSWCELWAAECLRVLKPGGHMLAFGGTRTYHRLACAVEDAGFEIRDSISWLYGSGFAKSWNFGTQFPGRWCECNALPLSHASNAEMLGMRSGIHPPAVARGESDDAGLFASLQRSATRPGVGEARTQRPRGMDGPVAGVVPREDVGRPESSMEGRELHRRQGLPQGSVAGSSERSTERLRPRARSGDGVDNWSAGDVARGSASHQRGPGGQSAREPEAVPGSHESLDDGALPDGPVCARCGGLSPVYKGFGTALKPSHEPIVVARKPLAGTVAGNVAVHGTGALNIDGCRVGTDEELRRLQSKTAMFAAESRPWKDRIDPDARELMGSAAGRWPTNVLLDQSQADALDAETGVSVSRSGAGIVRHGRSGGIMGAEGALRDGRPEGHDDTGGASRFFPTFRYEAKAPQAERPRDGATVHPTVKPLDLMRWLVRLVTPRGGTVLDPFLGSGTTAEACVLEGLRCIGIEREADYLPLTVARLSKPLQVGFDFGESA